MLKYFYALLQEKETANIAFKLETSKGYLNNVPNSSPIAFTSSTSGSYSVYTLYKMPIVFQHYLPNTVDTSKVYVVNKQENYFFEYWSLNNANKGSGCEVNEQKTYTNGTTYTYIANFYKGIKITLDANTGRFNLSNSSTCITINGSPIATESDLKISNCAETGYEWSNNKITLCYKSSAVVNITISRAGLTHTNSTYELAGWNTIKNSNNGRKRTWAFDNSSSSTTLYATWGVETPEDELRIDDTKTVVGTKDITTSLKDKISNKYGLIKKITHSSVNDSIDVKKTGGAYKLWKRVGDAYRFNVIMKYDGEDKKIVIYFNNELYWGGDLYAEDDEISIKVNIYAKSQYTNLFGQTTYIQVTYLGPTISFTYLKVVDNPQG